MSIMIMCSHAIIPFMGSGGHYKPVRGITISNNCTASHKDFSTGNGTIEINCIGGGRYILPAGMCSLSSIKAEEKK